MSKLKLFLYSAAGAVFLVLTTILYKIFVQKARKDDRIEDFKQQIDTKKMEIHQEIAAKAGKEAHKHIEKARTIATKKDTPKSVPDSLDDAISDWNDDTF
jgi:hypothetical protein